LSDEIDAEEPKIFDIQNEEVKSERTSLNLFPLWAGKVFVSTNSLSMCHRIQPLTKFELDHRCQQPRFPAIRPGNVMIPSLSH
jgi:hypothetical protein